MGVLWAPRAEGGSRTQPANLDAVCVLLDSRARALEVIHPRRLTNANGSVVHTGDSRDGESAWDDERVFVFLEALPREVDALVLGVVSADGRPFCEVPGASCHLSDYMTEDELLSVELTGLGFVEEYCVATLQRTAGGWVMRQGPPRGVNADALLSRSIGVAREHPIL